MLCEAGDSRLAVRTEADFAKSDFCDVQQLGLPGRNGAAGVPAARLPRARYTQAIKLTFAVLSSFNHAFSTAAGSQLVKLSFVPIAMLGAPDTLMYLTAALTCLGVIFGSKFEGAGGVIRQLWGFYHVFDATLQRSALAPAVASSMLALKAIYFFERRERIRKKDRENFGFWHAAEHLDVALFCMSQLAPRTLHPVLMARIGAGLACCTIVAASHDLHTCNELIISGAAIMIVLFLVPHDGPAVALGPLALSSFHLALFATTLYAAALYSRRLPRRLRAVVECGVLYACEGQAGLSRWAVAMVIEQGFSQVMHPFVLLAPHIAQTWAAECTGWDVAGCIYQLTFLALFIMPAWNINFRHNTDPLLLALYYVVPLTSWARAAAVFLFFHVCATASFAAFSRSMWPASPEVLEAVPQVLRELFLKKLRGNSHSMQLSGFLVKPYAPLLTNENISFMQLEEAMLRHHQHSMVAASFGAAGALLGRQAPRQEPGAARAEPGRRRRAAARADDADDAADPGSLGRAALRARPHRRAYHRRRLLRRHHGQQGARGRRGLLSAVPRVERRGLNR